MFQPGSEGSMEMTMEEAAAVEQMQQLTGITDPSQLLMLVMSMNEVDPQVFMMLGDPQVQGILSSLQEILALLDTPSDQQVRGGRRSRLIQRELPYISLHVN